MVSVTANRRIRVRAGICALVKRKLRGEGRIIAQKNTEVKPNDLIGKYHSLPGFVSVDLAGGLNASPMEIPKFLQTPLGHVIAKGQPLASKKGMIRRANVISPTDGIFEGIDQKTGEARIRLLPKEVALVSGVYGIIHDIDSKKGEVTIKTMITELYGVAGVGNEREGILNVIGGAGDTINKINIDVSHGGQILVLGSLALEETVKHAFKSGVSGVISGGVNLKDYLAMGGKIKALEKVSDIGISLLVTEGFGGIPIGEDMFEILRKHSGKFALIQGNLGRVLLPSDDSNSILTCRKVEFPLVEALSESPQLSIEEIKVGLKVRLISPPFMGSQGEVIAIDNNPTKLESGILTYLATVGTKMRKVKVPFSNLEIIG